MKDEWDFDNAVIQMNVFSDIDVDCIWISDEIRRNTNEDDEWFRKIEKIKRNYSIQ